MYVIISCDPKEIVTLIIIYLFENGLKVKAKLYIEQVVNKNLIWTSLTALLHVYNYKFINLF